MRARASPKSFGLMLSALPSREAGDERRRETGVPGGLAAVTVGPRRFSFGSGREPDPGPGGKQRQADQHLESIRPLFAGKLVSTAVNQIQALANVGESDSMRVVGRPLGVSSGGV